VCQVAGATAMPRTAHTQPNVGVQSTSPLTCHIVTSGMTFQVRGEHGLCGTNPGKFLAPHSPFPTPSTVFSNRCGPASSRAMQCSQVEQESKLHWDDGQTGMVITE
jgi:hypothetical protein